jgi:hypothetical protein
VTSASSASATTASMRPERPPSATPASSDTSASAEPTKDANVLLLVHDRDVRVLTSKGELIAELRIDPDRTYQPHH